MSSMGGGQGGYTAMGATMGSLFGPWGTAIGAVVGVVADLTIGKSQAKQAKEDQEEYLKGVRDNAVLNQTYANRQMNLQHQQLQQQGAEEKLDTKISALKIADRIGMSATENGVGGNSIKHQLAAVLGKGQRASNRIDSNLGRAGAQLMIGKQRGTAAAQSQVAGIQTQRTGVNYAGIGAAAVGAGADTYKQGVKEGKWKGRPEG